jgi:cysteine desulfurase
VRLPVYLDYNATTPVAPEVAAAILPFLHERFGNPSSSHGYGRHAAEAIAEARAEVAMLVGAKPVEIVFTGSATEANNLAMFGVARALAGKKRHLVTSAIEHPAVEQPLKRLRAEGWQLTVVPVDSAGCVDPDVVRRALRADTALVSIMHANNEIGTIQPIAKISALAHEAGALMHTDAAQSAAKIPVDVNELGADLLTLAGHKFYATKGVGALYVRSGTAILPHLAGAEQEHGLRPGTECVPLVVGLGVAARLARERLPGAGAHLQQLRDQLDELLRHDIPDLRLNGHPTERLPNTLHVSFPRANGAELLKDAASHVAASVGSACHSASDELSGVLAAIGAEPRAAAGAVRLSVGMPTTPDEIKCAAQALIKAWQRLCSGAGSRSDLR